MPSPSESGPGRGLVVIPTYNEAETLPATLRTLLGLETGLHVLVVDDASPDGTGEIADRIAETDPRVRVLHRLEKGGLGSAYLAGFAHAAEAGYPLVVEFDADGSHPADVLPAMLGVLELRPEIGLVIGSRWVPGGDVADWSRVRRLLSRNANRYARLMLRIPVRDSTSGFRIYRTTALASMHTEDVHSRGYCFQIDMTLRAVDAGVVPVELPIVFHERVAGASKMSAGIIAEAMLRVTQWGVQRAVRRTIRRRPTDA